MCKVTCGLEARSGAPASPDEASMTWPRSPASLEKPASVARLEYAAGASTASSSAARVASTCPTPPSAQLARRRDSPARSWQVDLGADGGSELDRPPQPAHRRHQIDRQLPPYPLKH